ncbi:hypothetical protein CRE_28279 [Caenorhabditis remanei]|uniref:Uncharacterized protein n=2 Tax=Caenorhabditis remanei TaxID=31234 RepID=E3LN39_CAERE|nr:hypothetical protein CRE_28279 [Caenorhabditis remanei]
MEHDKSNILTKLFSKLIANASKSNLRVWIERFILHHKQDSYSITQTETTDSVIRHQQAEPVLHNDPPARQDQNAFYEGNATPFDVMDGIRRNKPTAKTENHQNVPGPSHEGQGSSSGNQRAPPGGAGDQENQERRGRFNIRHVPNDAMLWDGHLDHTDNLPGYRHPEPIAEWTPQLERQLQQADALAREEARSEAIRVKILREQSPSEL